MWDGIREYGWNSAEGPHSCDYIMPEVLNILRSYPQVKRICDVGSGNGVLVAALARDGYEACGVEYDKEGCRIAAEQYPSIRFFNLGVQDAPKQVVDAWGAADAVVSTEVVEHLFSPHLLPRFAHGLLPRGGLLIISTPYHGYWKNLALAVLGKWDHHHTALWHGGHIKFFSRQTLTTLLEENGFRVVAFHGAGRMPWLWKSMILVAEAV